MAAGGAAPRGSGVDPDRLLAARAEHGWTVVDRTDIKLFTPQGSAVRERRAVNQCRRPHPEADHGKPAETLSNARIWFGLHFRRAMTDGNVPGRAGAAVVAERLGCASSWRGAGLRPGQNEPLTVGHGLPTVRFAPSGHLVDGR
jgi:hypothetical protein